MKLRILLILVCFILVQKAGYAQNNIRFDVDYAKFNYDKESVYLELYYSFAQNSLEKRVKDSSLFISANLKVNLIDEENKPVVDENYTLNSSVDTNSTEYKSEDLIGVLGFQVPCGKYKLAVSVKDNYGVGNSKTFSDDLDLSPFSDSSVSVSDIQLCCKIIKDGADPNSIYYKNSLETVPNPKALYGSNLPVLYYYLELYNNENSLKNSNFKFERILKQNQRVVDSLDERISLNNNALVKAGFVNLSKYNSGRYTLFTRLVDSSNNVLASKSKNFFVYNPNNNANTFNDAKLGYIKSEFGIYNEEECNYNFEVSKYIAAESEKDLYESLNTLDAKRKFLYEFWKKRDLTPETPLNEYKLEYMGRVAYVNSNYGHRHRAGYKTDRGRVALVYGIPDRVDSRSNEAEYKPYEVWSYDSIEGGVVFIFGDTMGISELELLHSTKRGEIINRNWQRRLAIKGGY